MPAPPPNHCRLLDVQYPMDKTRKEKIKDLKAEIERLEAEEFSANAGKRFEDFLVAVSQTGYFRYRQEFYKAKPNSRGWLEDDGMYCCDALYGAEFFCLNTGGVSIDIDGVHVFSTFDPQDVFPISAEEFEAARAMLSSVRSQIVQFLLKYTTYEKD